MIPNTISIALTSLLLFVSPAASLKPQVQPAHNTVEQAQWQKLEPKTYTVQKGDTLASIALAVYGDGKYWTTLWSDNQWIDNPNTLYSEWHLTIRDQKPEQETQLPEILRAKLVAAAQPRAVLQATKQQSVPEAKQEALDTIEPKEKPLALDEKTSNFDDLYRAAGDKYDVPWQVLYGLHVTETGQQGSGNIKNHQGTGATGPMQFMPGTWKAYGVDCNGDGVADITNVEDSVCGAANFIQKHGSLESGLRAYGGNTAGTLRAAASQGYIP